MKNKITLFLILLFVFLTGCAKKENDISAYEKTGSMELKYSTQFGVDFYDGGYAYIYMTDGREYVLVPEGGEDNNFGFNNATIIHKPLDDIYLAATSVMDLFLQLDELDLIGMVSTKAQDYSIPEAADAINQGKMKYVGKYSAPDYELLLDEGCKLAIESTMIEHSPKVKEQLEKLGIPVLVERSSYEASPLGRVEWIKLYGLLLGKEKEAELFFDEQEKKINQVVEELNEQKSDNVPTVAFFYISSNGYVNVRKPGDYISKMIEIAGGKYVLADMEFDNDNALSTMNINWEDFYDKAHDADVIIYNSTINGGLNSIDDLIAQNELLADFKAVKEGNVWCTGSNMFQESSSIADVIVDMHSVITEAKDKALDSDYDTESDNDKLAGSESLKYIYRLK